MTDTTAPPPPSARQVGRFLLKWAAPDADQDDLRRYVTAWTSTPTATIRLIAAFAVVSPDTAVPENMSAAQVREAARIVNGLLELGAARQPEALALTAHALEVEPDPYVVILCVPMLLEVATEILKTDPPIKETPHA
jgi:hypothetical protein